MTIELKVDDRGVAMLTLDRPEKHNAMSAQMIADLYLTGERIAADRTIRVVVLGGNGRSFCAGGDLGWMRDQMQASVAERRAGARNLAAMLDRLNTLPQPVIGCVHGNAFGGGVGLMSICDTVYSVPHAKFGLTETRLGLVPATIGPYVFARMGEAAARRVFMSSRVFDAVEAKELGIVSHIVATDDLANAIAAEVEGYLACAPGAVANAKEMTRSFGTPISEDVINRSVDLLIKQWESDEALQGINAFFDKTPPPWAISTK